MTMMMTMMLMMMILITMMLMTMTTMMIAKDRKHVQKLGPAIVYAQDNGIVRAFRNIPGVEVLDVNNLNVLRLAPGGHVGRFLIFTEDAFKALDTIYGNFSA